MHVIMREKKSLPALTVDAAKFNLPISDWRSLF